MRHTTWTRRRWIAVGLAATLGAMSVPAPLRAQTRHSGTIVAVTPESRTIALEELGVEGKPMRRTIALAPDARVVRVERSEDNGAPGAWPGGFRERPAEPQDLRPGDFVTVTLGDESGTPVARVVEVVRGGEAAASPR